MEENPYHSPSQELPDSKSNDDPCVAVLQASQESLETLEFTAKLVRAVAVFCGLGALVYLFTTLMGFYYLMDSEWGVLHVAQTYRLLIFPTMTCLCVFGWKYANAISRISKQETRELEFLTNAQGYFWLFVVLHVFIILCGVALSITLSYSVSNGEVW